MGDGDKQSLIQLLVMIRAAASLALASCTWLLLCSASSDDSVTEIDSTSFDAFIAENPLVLVQFYAPWCGHCKQFAPEFEVAALSLRSHKIPLIKVDASSERNTNLAEKYEIQGFPTLKLFRSGKVSNYGGERSADAIVSYMKKRSGPACKELSSQPEVETFKSEHDAVVVGFFSDVESAHYRAFEQAAKNVADIPFGNVVDAAARDGLGAHPDSVVLYKTFDEPETKYTAELTAGELEAFVKLHSLPKVITFSEKTAAQIFESGIKTHLVVFYDKTTRGGLETEVLQPATKWRGKFLFIHIPPSEEQIMDYFGVTKQELPAVRIVDLTSEQMKKFAFKGSEITGSTIDTFLQDYTDGKVEQVLKSEDIPTKHEGDIRTIVQKTFQAEVIEADQDVLVEFYAPWCGHCKELQPKYSALATSLKEVKTVVIAKVNAETNELPKVKIEGFPTIKLWPAGKKDTPVDYTGERTEEGLMAFLKEHATHKWFGDKRDDL